MIMNIMRENEERHADSPQDAYLKLSHTSVHVLASLFLSFSRQHVYEQGKPNDEPCIHLKAVSVCAIVIASGSGSFPVLASRHSYRVVFRDSH